MVTLHSVPDVVVYRCHDLGCDRVEVGVGEGLLDTLLNPVVWRRIGNVSTVCLASTTGEDADDATLGVGDDRPGIPGGGKSAILIAVRVDG